MSGMRLEEVMKQSYDSERVIKICEVQVVRQSRADYKSAVNTECENIKGQNMS